MSATLRLLLLLLLLVTLVSASHYIGGSMTCKVKGRNPDGTFRVDLHSKATFHWCYDRHNWFCNSGNCGNIVRTQSGQIESNKLPSYYGNLWCEAETVLTIDSQSDQPFEMREASCCWISNRNSNMYWRLLTHVDLGTRSDTGKPNNSPDIAIIPFLRAPQNCPRTYKLMAFDQDDDHVRCRYGSLFNKECYNCNLPPGFHLDQDSCTLYYNYSIPGVYGFELVVEDFPQHPITLAYTDGSHSTKLPLLSGARRKRAPLFNILYTFSTTSTTTPHLMTTSFIKTANKYQTTTSPSFMSSTTYPTTTAPPSAATTTANHISPHPTTPRGTTTTSSPWTTTTSPHPTTTAGTTTTSSPWTTTTSPHPTTTAGTTTTSSPWTTTTSPHPTTTAGTTTTSSPWTTTTSPHPTTTAGTTTTSSPWTTTTSPHPTTTAGTTTTSSPWTTTTSQHPTTTAGTTTTSSPWTTTTSPHPTTTAGTTTTSSPWTTTTSPHPTTTAGTTTTSSPWTTTTSPHPTTTAGTTTTSSPWTTTTSPHPTTTAGTTTTSSPWTTTTSPHPTTTAGTTTTSSPWTTTTSQHPTTTAGTNTTSSPWTTTTSPHPTTTAGTTTTSSPWNTAMIQGHAATITSPPATTTGWLNLSPISKLPLQFSFSVDPAIPSCQEGVYLPKFLPPTPENGAFLKAEVSKELEIRIKAQSSASRLLSLIISGPLNITKHKPTHDEFAIRWTPGPDDLGLTYAICFVAEAVSGSYVYQSEMRCIMVDVGRKQVELHVLCRESSMRVEFEKSSLSGLRDDQLQLSDPGNTVCSLQTHSNSTHIVAVIPLHACGTQIEEDDDNLIFKNELTTVENAGSSITRRHMFEVQFYCQYPKHGNVTLGFTVHRKNVTIWERGFGMFTYQFEFYPNDQFQTRIDPNSYPLEFEIGTLIHMQIEAASTANNTELFVESCRASPYDNPNYQSTYTIIEDGCEVDPTVQVHPAAHNKQFRFSMEAFKFIGMHDLVYISCSVMMCEAGNPDTRCSQGCISSNSTNSRHKRDVAVETARHFVSQGPLRLGRSSERARSPVANLNLNLVFVAGCLLAAVGMISAAAVHKTRTSKIKYQLLPAVDS